MEQVEELCDEIALMNLGKVVVSGTLREVKGSRGKKMVKIVFDGNDQFIKELDRFKIRVAERHPNQLLIELLDGVSPNEVLQFIVSKVTVITWNMIEPPLKEIFLNAVNNTTLHHA